MFPFKQNDRQHLSDTELVERYRFSYDNSYIGDLFQRYSHMLFGVAMNYLNDEERAKDAVMEVFEKVLQELKRHNVENFRTWVYSVTKNHCLMSIRKDKTIESKHEGFGYMANQIMESDEPAHLNGASEQEMDQRLYTAIDSLKDEQRQCIKLFYFEHRSYEEIESMTGLTYKEVKSHLQNGKRNLRIKLTQHNE